MPPSAHSAFSASAAKRLLACPGSYALGRALAQAQPPGRAATTSIFAAEGTAAHSLSEACLFSGQSPDAFVGTTLSADGFDFEVDETFAEAVTVYINVVKGLRALGYVVGLEVRVSPVHLWGGLPPLGIDLFGTGDTVAYNFATRHLVIADLKFGKGIPVDVTDNPQLKYYGAGSADPKVLRELCEKNGIDTSQLTDGELTPEEITLAVVQPRAPHPDGLVRRWNLSHRELEHWARQDLYLGVKAALDDDGTRLSAGEHCRFCPAFSVCSEPRKKSLAAAKDAFAAAPPTNAPATSTPALPLAAQLSDAELGDLMDKITLITPWIAAVKDHALERMKVGKSDVPGWKIVPKRAVRAWASDDDDELRDTLKKEGLSDDEFLTSQVLSPAKVQAKTGKKRYDAKVAPHVVKRSSGVTTAPDGDPRARVMAHQTPQQAFNKGTKP
jgi:hypothetical protein